MRPSNLTRRANQGHFSIDPKSCTPPRAEAVHDSEADEVVLRTIQTILTSFGIEEEDRAGLRADFQHLRRWRRSVEHAQSYTFKAMITVIVSGILGAAWLGLKIALAK
jgi:hypothetical protein